jgi:3',5'-cyclic AMP phosphodiesterase CpdA
MAESSDGAVVFVWPGDLHLTEAGLPNHQAGLASVEQINTLIRPDFVQFAGDNVQHAKPEEFAIFNDLQKRLKVPHQALVGDHDVHHDPEQAGYKKYIGEPYGASSLKGFHFIRLNTLEHKPVGFSAEQMAWFKKEVDGALAAGKKVVVFQHHYPFKVMETFDGPGIDLWREVVQTRRIEAIFCGHTHYGQIANDGKNVSIAARSIGDPEGGEAGYLVACLKGDDLAVTYRTTEDKGPLALITHPRDVLLATRTAHVVKEADRIEARVWSTEPVVKVQAKMDHGEWFDLTNSGENVWGHPLAAEGLAKGEHELEVRATDGAGLTGTNRIRWVLDNRGKFTAIPGVHPVVKSTKFC